MGFTAAICRRFFAPGEKPGSVRAGGGRVFSVKPVPVIRFFIGHSCHDCPSFCMNLKAAGLNAMTMSMFPGYLISRASESAAQSAFFAVPLPCF
jgi:hypothetical protein